MKSCKGFGKIAFLLVFVLLFNVAFSMITFADDTAEGEFADTKAHWAKAEIAALVKAGIVKGVDDTHFAPEDAITRAEFLALCFRATKIEEVDYANAYNDVSADAWYAKTVQAAKNAGLIDSGMTPDGSFKPEDPIKREEMTSVIVNAYDYLKGSKTESTNDLSKFEDKGEISPWAVPYTAAATDLKFIFGTTETTFSPKDNATRGEAAVIAKRLLDKNATPDEGTDGKDEPDDEDYGDSFSMLTSADVTKTSYRWTGYLGMQITVRANPLKVTHIGRLCFNENVKPHTLKIVEVSTNKEVASATIETEGKTPGKFIYAKLDSPVTLQANTSYYLISSEVERGDEWGDGNTLVTSEVVSIDFPVYGTEKDGIINLKPGGDTANNAFIPVDLKYIPTTSEGNPPDRVNVSIPETKEVPGVTYAYPTSLVIPSNGELEKFDIHMWIPAEVKTVRGIVFISEHGDGSGLARKNIAFREMAVRMNWAIVYFDSQTLKGFDNQKTCGDLLLAAIDDFAEKSGHEELVNCPFATYGHSNASAFAARFAAWKPERFFGVIAYKSANNGQFELKELAPVPLMVITGELDTAYGDNGQKEAVVDMRKYGSLVHYIMDPGAGHGTNGGKSNSVVFAFLEAAFNARVPADFDPTTGMVKLNTLNEKTGWLGDPDTHEIASYADYAGDKSSASWFINEAYAKQWKEFVENGVIEGIKLQ